MQKYHDEPKQYKGYLKSALVQRKPEFIPGGPGQRGALGIKLVTLVENDLRKGRFVEQQAEGGHTRQHRDRTTSLRAHLPSRRAEPATSAFQEHPFLLSPQPVVVPAPNEAGEANKHFRPRPTAEPGSGILPYLPSISASWRREAR